MSLQYEVTHYKTGEEIQLDDIVEWNWQGQRGVGIVVKLHAQAVEVRWVVPYAPLPGPFILASSCTKLGQMDEEGR